MLFDFSRKRLAEQFKPSQTTAIRSRGGRASTMREIRAGGCGPFSGGGSGGMGGMPSGGGGSNFQMSRFNGSQQNLEQGNITSEWLPQDPVGLNILWRQLYAHGSIEGPVVDLISNLPWSDWDLMGVEDSGHLKIFENAMTNLNVQNLMEPFTREYLVIGRVSGSLLFDSNVGTWTGFSPHDPDFITITPIPIFGHDPMLDKKLSPGEKKLMSTKDPRALEALKALPTDLLDQMRQGKVELDPISTLFVPRKTLMHDWIGTSFYTRMVPWYALEQNLITGTLIASRRRQRSILHLSIGLQDLWEPEPEEMEDIVNMFMQADEDPQGAIVATRTGVAAQELRDGNNFWKISDEIEMINNMKLRSAGLNEDLFNGSANFSTMDIALSVFMESIRALRQSLTAKIFYQKVFPELSRVYGLRKIQKNELEHRIKINKSPEEKERDLQEQVQSTLKQVQAEEADIRRRYEYLLGKLNSATSYKEMKAIQKISAAEGKKIPESELLIPKIHWHKELKPSQDAAYLEVLNVMESKGIPIPLKTWAAAGGVDLDKVMDMLKEDATLRKEIQDWKTASSQFEEGSAFASKVLGVKKAIIKSLPIFNKNKSFLGVTSADACNYIDTFAEKIDMLREPTEVEIDLNRAFDSNQHKISAMKFIMKRVGLVNFNMDKESIAAAVMQLSEAGLTKADVWKEIQVINRYEKQNKPINSKMITPEMIRQFKGEDQFTGTNATKLYSGL